MINLPFSGARKLAGECPCSWTSSASYQKCCPHFLHWLTVGYLEDGPVELGTLNSPPTQALLPSMPSIYTLLLLSLRERDSATWHTRVSHLVWTSRGNNRVHVQKKTVYFWGKVFLFFFFFFWVIEWTRLMKKYLCYGGSLRRYYSWLSCAFYLSVCERCLCLRSIADRQDTMCPLFSVRFGYGLWLWFGCVCFAKLISLVVASSEMCLGRPIKVGLCEVTFWVEMAAASHAFPHTGLSIG